MISARADFNSTAQLDCSPLSALQNERLAFGKEAQGLRARMYEQPTKFSGGKNKTDLIFSSSKTFLFKVAKSCFSQKSKLVLATLNDSQIFVSLSFLDCSDLSQS